VDPAPGRSFVDLHCHSSSSFDSLSSPADLVHAAQRYGLTHLAITDHERIDGAQRARDLAPAGVTVIVGEEVHTTGGDLLGLFLERAVAPGMSLAETAATIHEQGGLVGLPHPFDRFRSSGGAMSAEDTLAALAAAIDFVEVHNARAVGRANERAALFAREHGLPGVASSDAHSLMEVGVAYSVLPGSFSTAAGLRDLLGDGELVMGHGSWFVRAWTPIAKVVQRLRGNGRVGPIAPAGGRARP
jgi:predicted metal-dependent phosphoesterase TrpH